MKRYIKSGRYIGDYYLSDEEEAELQYYADHPELYRELDISENPIDKAKFPETYNFREHTSEINEGLAEANYKFSDGGKWSAKVDPDRLLIYWDYFKEVMKSRPYVEITYNHPDDPYSVWFKVVDPTGEDLSWQLEYNDDNIADLIVGLAGYISSRW